MPMDLESSVLARGGGVAVLKILLATEAALKVLVELRLGGLLVRELVPDRLELLLFLWPRIMMPEKGRRMASERDVVPWTERTGSRTPALASSRRNPAQGESMY